MVFKVPVSDMVGRLQLAWLEAAVPRKHGPKAETSKCASRLAVGMFGIFSFVSGRVEVGPF